MAGLVVLAVLAVTPGCRRAAEEVRPAGLHLVANGSALARALGASARLTGTPLGDASARSLEAARSCARVVASAPSGKLEDLLDALRCEAPTGDLALLAEQQGAADLAVASGMGGPWSVFVARVDAHGSLEGELTFPVEHRGMATLISPAEKMPGAALFSSDGALLRGRLRAVGGIDVDKLKTKGKTSEKMKLPDFAGVLSDTLLDGVWELAVYAPPSDRTVPRLAFALGVTSTRAANAGMDALLRELETSWQLHRSAFRVGDSEGACLLDLTVLPDLAPCWVLADDHIAIGWNQETLQHALAPERPRDAALAAGRLAVDFAGMSPVDEALTRAAFPDVAPATVLYPWSELSVEALGARRVKIALTAKGAAP